MVAESVKQVADFLADDFESEIQTTMRVMAAVPNDRLGYQPDATSKTGLGLLRHLALEDAWLLNCIADGEFTPPPDDSDACGIMSPADAVTRYQSTVPAALERVRALSDQQLSETLDMLGLMQTTPLNLLSVTLKHSVHHRGQLSAYLRAMGGKVPGIYGPSADTQE